MALDRKVAIVNLTTGKIRYKAYLPARCGSSSSAGEAWLHICSTKFETWLRSPGSG